MPNRRSILTASLCDFGMGGGNAKSATQGCPYDDARANVIGVRRCTAVPAGRGAVILPRCWEAAALAPVHAVMRARAHRRNNALSA
jgi:hypothetical protein